MALSFVHGRRGRSKAEVKLSFDSCFGNLSFQVWENGKITHSFVVGDKEFVKQLLQTGKDCLNYMEYQDLKLSRIG